MSLVNEMLNELQKGQQKPSNFSNLKPQQQPSYYSRLKYPVLLMVLVIVSIFTIYHFAFDNRQSSEIGFTHRPTPTPQTQLDTVPPSTKKVQTITVCTFFTT